MIIRTAITLALGVALGATPAQATISPTPASSPVASKVHAVWDPCSPLSYRIVGNKRLIKSEAPVLRAAFRAVSKQSGFRFVRTNDRHAQVTVTVKPGDGHGYGGTEAYSQGGVLGAPENPKAKTGGFIRLWTNRSIPVRLRKVLAAHEMGHVLGISHAPKPSSLMYPRYDRTDRLKFSAWDRRAFRAVSREEVGCMLFSPGFR